MSGNEMVEALKALGKYVILPSIMPLASGGLNLDLDGEREESPKAPLLKKERASSSFSFMDPGLYEEKPKVPIFRRDRTGGSSSCMDQTGTSQSHIHAVPKVPPFSGEDPPLKGDVTYPEWRFEIRCLDGDTEISQSLLEQAIRRSLRGTARRMLIPLGEKATPKEVLYKLDALSGETSTHGMLMQEFFKSAQKPGESVTNFGCRLESLLQTAIESGSLNKASKNDLLRHKFWT
ncbi:paraneoplastic antigen Ma3 homolog [Mizuhopecten yessoensis]|uniref:paraneoplastic antigen Ma3 homolog n=1 Tax=Mizuhopecten yessoensis TaxID=6573 RepID=UPI000B458108|nr:paraneoplastic antigen Ma3 homolog [Mizuhopecten yessoensis]